MPITNVAHQYLNSFLQNGEFEDGLSFRAPLVQLKFDLTKESLSRIDQLLDQIRIKIKPEFNDFLSNQANVNFLYLLAFYVGAVVEKHSGGVAEWVTYDELAAGQTPEWKKNDAELFSIVDYLSNHGRNKREPAFFSTDCYCRATVRRQ